MLKTTIGPAELPLRQTLFTPPERSSGAAGHSPAFEGTPQADAASGGTPALRGAVPDLTAAPLYDPVPTLFDFGSLSLAHALAFQDLLDMGLHAVLGTQAKQPIWTGWPDKRPTFDDLVHHDGPIAHIPGRQLGLVVYDADGGTLEAIEAFCQLYPPLLRVPSIQPGRAHLYYRSDAPVTGTHFSGHGVSGDIRSHAGYAVLWHDAVVLLRDALYTNRGRAAPAPLHLILETVSNPPAKAEAATLGPAPASRRSSPPSAASDETSPDPSIFDRVCHWAYETPEGPDYASWERRVLEEVRRCNAEMGHPLTERRVMTMAASIANWIWPRRANGSVPPESRRRDPRARRDGIASGVVRRRGTPLERDRTPWKPLKCSRATYYRKYRYAEGDQQRALPGPQPWITLGITPATFRQRVKRARAGTYKAAQQGVPPWDSVGISKEEWVEHYARTGSSTAVEFLDPSPAFGHAFETEPGLGGRPPRGPAWVCDPVLSAEILMDAVAAGRDGIPSSRPAAQGGEFRDMQKAVNRYISDQRSRLRRSLAQESAAIAVAAYLECLDIEYRVELARRGLPIHGLLRPLWHIYDDDSKTLEGRKKLAMARQQAHAHDLKTADRIYARALRLGMVPPTPPWVIAQEEAKTESVGWWMSREDRRLRRQSERDRWWRIIQTELMPTLMGMPA